MAVVFLLSLSACGSTAATKPQVPTATTATDLPVRFPPTTAGLAALRARAGFAVLLTPRWLPPGAHLCAAYLEPSLPPGSLMETSLIYCFAGHPSWGIHFDQISASGSLGGPGTQSVPVDGLMLQEMPASASATGFAAVVVMPLSKHLAVNVVGVHVTSLADLTRIALSARPPTSTP